MLLSKNSNLRLSALKVISLFTLLICVQGDQQKRHRTSSQARSETNVADRSSRWDDVESISESSGRYLGSENDYYYSMSYSYSKSKSKSKSQSEDEDNNGGKSLGDDAVPDEEEDPDTPPVTKSTVPPETTIKPTEDIESEDEPEDESEATIITSEAAMPAEKFMCDLEGAGISTDTELTETLISYYYDVQTSDDSKDWIGTLEQVMLGAISGMIDCDEKLISYDSSGKKIHRLLQSEVKVLGIDSKPGDVPTNEKCDSDPGDNFCTRMEGSVTVTHTGSEKEVKTAALKVIKEQYSSYDADADYAIPGIIDVTYYEDLQGESREAIDGPSSTPLKAKSNMVFVYGSILGISTLFALMIARRKKNNASRYLEGDNRHPKYSSDENTVGEDEI